MNESIHGAYQPAEFVYLTQLAELDFKSVRIPGATEIQFGTIRH
jgi:hypothetical protein